MGRFSFGILRIVDDLRYGSENTIIVGDMLVEVEFRVNVLSPRAPELGIEDAIDDADVLGGMAEALATPDKLAIYIPDESIERDGRRNIGLLVGFLALRSENALVDDDFATGGRDCHCASAIVDISTCGACYLLRDVAYLWWGRVRMMWWGMRGGCKFPRFYNQILHGSQWPKQVSKDLIEMVGGSYFASEERCKMGALR